MRKTFGFLALGGLVALAVAQTGGTVLASFAKAINDANSVSSTYTIQQVGSGGPENYSVTLKKPNLARIETPQSIVVADGKQITHFDKSEKTYYVEPQNEDNLKGLMANDELGLFAGFFNADAYKAASVKSLGQKSRKGQVVDAVVASVDASGKKTVTYYIAADKMAHGASIDFNDPTQKVTYVIDTKSLDVDGSLPGGAFAFNPPADSKMISLADLNSNKWYTDINEAMSIAKSGKKKIFVDFMATWCGPCKMLDREVLQTEGFKKLGSKLVFLRIDVDAQKDVASHYGITAMPTQMILDSSGNVLAQTVGYGGPDAFYSWLNGSL